MGEMRMLARLQEGMQFIETAGLTGDPRVDPE